MLLPCLTDRFIDKLHRQIKNHLQDELEVYKLKDKQNLENDNKTSYAKDFRKEMKSSITEKAFQNTLKGVARHGDTPITLTELDNPTLLNLKDVTLNLTTLEPHEHNITDLCTKYVDTELNTPLNPEAINDWNKFISDIMCNDPHMIEFLQRVCGYILEVANKEECFFILYGRTTRNGKSTLLGAISRVLNDYVKTVSSATLSERPTGKEANPEVINLIGAKLITCGELNSETLLNDTLLKSISGNDPQSARNLFSNDILNFKIDGKLFANCNELPPMKNDDLLNSMRIIVIPFDRHFEEFEQDKNLKEKFNRAEYKAVILQWILIGYKRYLKYGIKAHMPKKVIRAIDEYHSEANSINAFLNDTLHVVACRPHFKDTAYNSSGNGIDHRCTLFVITLEIPVGRKCRPILARLCSRLNNSSDLLGRVGAVPLIKNIHYRHHVHSRTCGICRIHVVRECDEANVIHWEYVICVLSYLDIITTKSAQILAEYQVYSSCLGIVK